MACAAHCLVLPVFGLLAGLHPDAVHGPAWVHAGMIAVAGLIGYATLCRDYREHSRPSPLLFLTAGLALMTAGHWTLRGATAAASGAAGAVLVIAAQWANRRLSASCCPERRQEARR